MAKKIVFLQYDCVIGMADADRIRQILEPAAERCGIEIVILQKGCRVVNPEDLDPIVKSELRSLLSEPIPMILHCPSCHEQHIDMPEPAGFCDDGWTNPPHRSHLCHRCGTIWRPADVPTVGVEKIETKGKDDKIVQYVDPEEVEKVSRALRGGDGWKQR